MTDGPTNPDPSVRPDTGGWTSGGSTLPPVFHVFLHSGDDTTSYVVHAADELTAAAIAGQEHEDRIDGADAEPWTAP